MATKKPSSIKVEKPRWWTPSASVRVAVLETSSVKVEKEMKMATKQHSKKLTEYLERIQKSETVEMSFGVVLETIRDDGMNPSECARVSKAHNKKWFAMLYAYQNLRRAQDRVNKLLNQPTKENHGN